MAFNTIITLTVIFAIIQVALSIIPIIFKDVKEPVIDKNKKYSKKDYALIALPILGLGISIFTLLLNDENENTKEAERRKIEDAYNKKLEEKLSERDSLHSIKDSTLIEEYNKRVDISYQNSIRNSNEALAKYNLILIDSLRKVESNINKSVVNKPQLTVAPADKITGPPIYLETRDNEKTINVKLLSQNNTSYNINIKYFLFRCLQMPNKDYSYNFISTGQFSDRNHLTQSRFATETIPLKTNFNNLECYIVLLLGSFSADQENTLKFKFEESYYFEPRLNNSIGISTKSGIENLKSYLNDMKIQF